MSGNRDWILETLARRTAAVPYNFMFSPPARRKVEEHYGGGPIEDVLDLPIRMSGPVSIKPLYADPGEFGPTARDEYGVVWSTSVIDRGSPIRACLLEPDLTGYTFPDPSRQYRFEGLDQWRRAHADCYTVVWVGDLWERATFMRGMESILLDIATHPGFVRRLLRGIADYILATMDILMAGPRFDSIAISDDYGTQKAMLMSPQDWRRLVRPLLAEIFARAKEHGCKTFLHTCGNVRAIIGDLIDVGLDVLHPIQPEAMDIFELKREFGRDITFCGGVRTQDLLPRGRPNEVREEVRRLKDRMGRGGGYILEPGITLQDDVPVANMVAMIDEARAGA